MRKIRQCLFRLKNSDMCKDISFKSWRAGRATELLKTHSVAQIFDMGEWKGAKSVVRYADEDQIDPVKLLEAAMDCSEEETDELVPVKRKEEVMKKSFWMNKRRKSE